jgi:polyisoprenyl-teichoic acid--peptidoglycan teichoic acid transferase
MKTGQRSTLRPKEIVVPQETTRAVGSFTGMDSVKSVEAPAASQYSQLVSSPITHGPMSHTITQPTPEGTTGKKKSTGLVVLGGIFAFVVTFLKFVFKPKRFALILLSMVVVGGGWLGYTTWKNVKKTLKGGGSNVLAFAKDLDPNQLQREGDGRANILVLGRGGEGHDGGELTDSIVVVSIDPTAKEVGLLSVPRDLYVVIEETGEGAKINSVYENVKNYALSKNASVEEADKKAIIAVEKQITKVTGLPINRYVIVDFEAFRQAIDAVGGIDIDVQTAIYDPNFRTPDGKVLSYKKGMQKMDGNKALFYVRTRYTSTGGDYDRGERQRQVITALKEKILSVGTFSNPIKVTKLLNALGDHVNTNIAAGEIETFYKIAGAISTIESVGFHSPTDPLTDNKLIDGIGSVEAPVAGLTDYSDIRSYVMNKLRDGFLKSEDSSVVVLNGSGIPGLAKTKTEELKSYGYSMLAAGDATGSYLTTKLYDLTKGKSKYTKRYLEQRLSVSATTDALPAGVSVPESAKFVILLGSNEKQIN